LHLAISGSSRDVAQARLAEGSAELYFRVEGAGIRGARAP
jgi:hypothetical protein